MRGRIAGFNPDSQIIVMLRNPVEMLYSYHSQLVYSRNEDIESFEGALRAEEARKKEGRRIPRGCRWPPLLFYRDIGSFSRPLERYFETFGRQNVLVLIFDDFVADTEKVYLQTLQFLGVNEGFRPEFRVYNANTRARSGWLMYLRYNYPRWVQRLVRALLPSRSLRDALKGVFQKMNTSEEKRPPMDPALRSRLRREFEPEVEKLSELLGRDLSHWVSSETP